MRLIMWISLIVSTTVGFVAGFQQPLLARGSGRSSATLALPFASRQQPLFVSSSKSGGDETLTPDALVDVLLQTVDANNRNEEDGDGGVDGSNENGEGAIVNKSSSSNGTSTSVAVESIVKQLEELEVFNTTTEQGSNNQTASGDSVFSPLFGYYDVAFTLTTKENDNPVGGKWTRSNGFAQKLLSTERTLQHILPYNTTGLCSSDPTGVAEAVNVITLRALFSWFTINVILRGDAVPISNDGDDDSTDLSSAAVSDKKSKKARKKPKLLPLSPRAVKAYFDSPRIIITRTKNQGNVLNLRLGPTSAVVLDTTYIDHRVRIGMGGTSGTRFVFRKCAPDDDGARRFLPLLQHRPVRKWKLSAVLSSMIASSLWMGFFHFKPSQRAVAILFKALSVSVSSVWGLILALILTGTGGIETDCESYQSGLR